MCGLVGVAGAIGPYEEKAFKDLLVVDVLRGPHSTGICAVDVAGGVTMYKDAKLPSDLFKENGFKDMMTSNHNVLMGHNRWATQGAVNAENAHPFRVGDIIGMHNGTLAGQYLLPDFQDYEVDSKNLIHSLNKIGTKDTWNITDGAAALVWYNREKETLHFLRNKERSFFYTFSTDGKTLFWASEDWMLTVILKRNNIKHNAVISTAVNREYTLDIDFQAAHLADKIAFEKHVHHKPYTFTYNRYIYPTKPKARVFGFTPNKGSDIYQTGTEVTFQLSAMMPPNKTCDFYGFIKGKPEIEVEIFGTTNTYVSELLSDPSGDFTGKVNTYYRRNDKAYKVTIQGNSIKRVPKGNVIHLSGGLPVVKKFSTPSGDEWLDEKEFHDLTLKGCAYCQHEVTFDEGTVFDSDLEPICETCTEAQWFSEQLL